MDRCHAVLLLVCVTNIRRSVATCNNYRRKIIAFFSVAFGYTEAYTAHMDGKNIRLLRKRLNLTAAKFADFLGVDRITIWRWETDAIRPSKFAERELERMAEASKTAAE